MPDGDRQFGKEFQRTLDGSILKEMAQLRDEVERLRAENKQLHTDYQRICCGHDQLHNERDEAREEIARLQELLRGIDANRYWEGRWRDETAEVERLRAALLDAWVTLTPFNMRHYHHTLVALQARLSAALSPGQSNE